MKIQTNYDTMTNEQLLTELSHRFSTFGETLGGYESGGLKISIQQQEYWLDDCTTNGSLEFNLDFENPGNVDLVIEPENKQYRELLLQLLKVSYKIQNLDDKFSSRSQQEQLQDRMCKVCRELDAHQNYTQIIACHMSIKLKIGYWTTGLED